MTVRQVEVLQWIGEGCPDGVWADFTYKTTAYALASRGLVTVDRRRNRWSAILTDDGLFYLRNGSYPTDAAAATESSRAAHGSDASGLAAELLNRLTAGSGQVTIESPSDSQRARYRQAIHHLIANHQIPQGYLVRHTGRDRGDLSIRLIREADAPKAEPVPKVEVRQVGAEVSDAVRALARRIQLAVTEPTMDRALQILQAIANECVKRGWSLEVDSRDDRRFQITTTECSFDLLLREELVDAELPDGDTLAAAKYPWQRVPLQVCKIGSGRLTLQLGQYYRTRSWSDRSRWRLDDKLGALFVELDNRVAEAAYMRREREADLLRRQRAWDEAAAAAKRAYVLDLNRRRLTEQVSDHRRAQELRDYANLLGDRAGGVDDAVGESISRWQQFARAEADRIDPAGHIDQLGYVEPDTVTADDFAPFMPKGMNAHRRPTQ